MTSKTSIVQKLLALAASAALIGSPCEAEAAMSRAMTIAAAHGIDIKPLAAAAGVKIPVVSLISSSTMDTGRGYTLTRTIDRAGKIEVCTIGEDGRTEVYTRAVRRAGKVSPRELEDEAAGADDVVAGPVDAVDSMTDEEAADAEFARWEEKREVARLLG